MPEPSATPKCGKDAGDTTSTSTPPARTASTAASTKFPATGFALDGYVILYFMPFRSFTFMVCSLGTTVAAFTCPDES